MLVRPGARSAQSSGKLPNGVEISAEASAAYRSVESKKSEAYPASPGSRSVTSRSVPNGVEISAEASTAYRSVESKQIEAYPASQGSRSVISRSGESKQTEASPASRSVISRSGESKQIEASPASRSVTSRSGESKQINASPASRSVTSRSVESKQIEASSASRSVASRSLESKQIEASSAPRSVTSRSVESKQIESSLASRSVTSRSVESKYIEASPASPSVESKHILEECHSPSRTLSPPASARNRSNDFYQPPMMMPDQYQSVITPKQLETAVARVVAVTGSSNPLASSGLSSPVAASGRELAAPSSSSLAEEQRSHARMISTLQTQVESLSKEIKEMQAKQGNMVRGANAATESLRADTNGLQQALVKCQQKHEDVTGKLENDIKSLQEQMLTRPPGAAQLQGQEDSIRKLEKDIESLQEQMLSRPQEVARQDGQEESIRKLEENIRNLQGQILARPQVNAQPQVESVNILQQGALVKVQDTMTQKIERDMDILQRRIQSAAAVAQQNLLTAVQQSLMVFKQGQDDIAQKLTQDMKGLDLRMRHFEEKQEERLRMIVSANNNLVPHSLVPHSEKIMERITERTSERTFSEPSPSLFRALGSSSGAATDLQATQSNLRALVDGLLTNPAKKNEG